MSDTELEQRVAGAEGSRDLSERIGTGDVDILRAVGMAGAHNLLGTLLWRLRYTGDTRELRRTAELLMDRVQGRYGHLKVEQAGQAVGRVLRHWLNDVCPVCTGRGYDLIPDTPTLSDTLCAACNGAGRTELDALKVEERWLQGEIAILESDAAQAIMRKLAWRMRD
jgi:hypothetical protein